MAPKSRLTSRKSSAKKTTDQSRQATTVAPSFEELMGNEGPMATSEIEEGLSSNSRRPSREASTPADGSGCFSYVDEATWTMNPELTRSSPSEHKAGETSIYAAFETVGKDITQMLEPSIFEEPTGEMAGPNLVISDPENTLSNRRVLRKSTVEKGKQRFETS